jgi:hypothetical protein
VHGNSAFPPYRHEPPDCGQKYSRTSPPMIVAVTRKTTTGIVIKNAADNRASNTADKMSVTKITRMILSDPGVAMCLVLPVSKEICVGGSVSLRVPVHLGE